MRDLAVFVAVLVAVGCSSTVAVRRPFSDAALAELNREIEGRDARLVVVDPERALRERALQAAAIDACQRAPGDAMRRSGEGCFWTADCECGLTCQAQRCQGNPATPPPLEVRNVTVGRETTSWLEVQSGSADEPRTVPSSALRSITLRHRGLGAIQGFGLGVLIGGATGAGLGALVGSRLGNPYSEGAGGSADSLGAVVGAAVGVGLGVLIGPVAGAVVGRRTTFELEQ